MHTAHHSTPRRSTSDLNLPVCGRLPARRPSFPSPANRTESLSASVDLCSSVPPAKSAEDPDRRWQGDGARGGRGFRPLSVSGCAPFSVRYLVTYASLFNRLTVSERPVEGTTARCGRQMRIHDLTSDIVYVHFTQ